MRPILSWLWRDAHATTGGPAPSWYPLLMFAGIACTLFFWSRLARRDSRLLIIYVSALCSAFIGAKLVFFLAEGWLYWSHPQRWLIFATGKSVVGALLGGYAGVELAKWGLRYPSATGDFFALVVPLGVAIGRVGCLLHGCCPGAVCPAPQWWTVADSQGIPRWPAVPAEIVFNLLALGLVLLVTRARRSRPALAWTHGQLFHGYLVAYGLFRLAHEALRATPRVFGPWSGYQLAALALVLLGLICGYRRWRGGPSMVAAAPTQAG